MKRAGAAILAMAMAIGVRAQDDKKAAAGGDKIGKDKPPVVAAKFLAEVQKRKGSAIAEIVQMGAQPQQIMTNFEGVLRKDFAAVKGTAEVYAKGSSYLINTGARFDPPEDLTDQNGAQASSFKNPSLFLPDLQKITAGATFGGDEVVDGKDCIVVDFVASPELVRQYIKELSERLERRRGPGGGGFGVGGRGSIFNLQSAVDEKKTVATFRTCVGKADLLLYKLEFVMKPELKPNAMPKEFRLPPLDQKVEVKFSKWDEEVAFDIPGFIKTKWGVK